MNRKKIIGTIIVVIVIGTLISGYFFRNEIYTSLLNKSDVESTTSSTENIDEVSKETLINEVQGHLEEIKKISDTNKNLTTEQKDNLNKYLSFSEKDLNSETKENIQKVDTDIVEFVYSIQKEESYPENFKKINEQIKEANYLLSTYKVGTNAGECPKDVYDEFKKNLEETIQFVNEAQESNNLDFTNRISNLEYNINNFKDSIISSKKDFYNSLNTKLKEAEDLLSKTNVGNNIGEISLSNFKELNDEYVRCSDLIDIATEAQLKEEEALLTQKLSIFKETIITKDNIYKISLNNEVVTMNDYLLQLKQESVDKYPANLISDFEDNLNKAKALLENQESSEKDCMDCIIKLHDSVDVFFHYETDKKENLKDSLMSILDEVKVFADASTKGYKLGNYPESDYEKISASLQTYTDKINNSENLEEEADDIKANIEKINAEYNASVITEDSIDELEKTLKDLIVSSNEDIAPEKNNYKLFKIIVDSIDKNKDTEDVKVLSDSISILKESKDDFDNDTLSQKFGKIHGDKLDKAKELISNSKDSTIDLNFRTISVFTIVSIICVGAAIVLGLISAIFIRKNKRKNKKDS